MQILRTCLILFAASAAALQAQSHGYGFIGTGSSGRQLSGGFRYGLGGEWGIAPHLSIGGEVGGLRKRGVNGMISSANVTGHFRPGVSRGLDPFVTGGASVGYVPGSVGFWVNLGGGANYWFHRHFGARGEFRGYLGGQDLHSFSEFRFGITFR